MAHKEHTLIRPLVDKVGFASTLSQLETFLGRVEEQQGELLNTKRASHNITESTSWKLSICPHDDYTYCGYMYPLVLRQVKTKTVFIIAVAHKAAQFNLENRLIFDDYSHWQGVRSPIPVSHLRAELLQRLEGSMREVHKPMQEIEHSVESMLPFLQYYNPEVEIVPILVPFMPFNRIQELSEALATAIVSVTGQHEMVYGKDYSILITTDSVHYGDDGWNGRNCDRFGVDQSGYTKALEYEDRIIDECFVGKLTGEKVQVFYKHTVSAQDYHKYNWTWCGRYSIPLGLLTAKLITEKLKQPSLQGTLLEYSTSLAREPIPVSDLDGMGITAPANLRHWVGYTAIGYL